MQPIPSILLAAAAALAASLASAQEQPVYNRVDLNASVQREVPNDLMIAVVYAEVEDNDQSEAAAEVNASIQWAAARAREIDGIELETLQYTTRPVYTPGSRRIARWIARQSLRLKSRDAETLSELLGELQQRVAVEALFTELSPAARDAAEEALIAEAIAAFRRRAELVAAELGFAGYRLLYMSVGSSGYVPNRGQVRALGLAQAADSFAPEIEPGEQTVAVSVNGTIELEPSP